MSGKNNGQRSGLEVQYEGGHKAITDVIRVYNLAGDDIRAKLLEAIRAALLEAQAAHRQAVRYVEQEAAQPG